MLLPNIKTKEADACNLKVFGGLDRRDKISDSSFTEMENMSADSAPALSPRKARSEIADAEGAQNITAPQYADGALTSFTGVRNNRFYYNGTEIKGTLNDGKKSIADFNGKICIFPDKVYYDYLPSPDSGEVSDSLTSMEKTMILSGAKFYSSKNDISGEYTAYISSSGSDFSENFAEGDSIVISGCSTEKNNTHLLESRLDTASDDEIVSAVVTSAATGKLYLQLYNKYGEKICFVSATETGSITLKKAIPDMDHICVHNNRLWGTASSGEYIYASKMGDCTDFNSFAGLSTDSWYSYIATGGSFTGICSYRTAVVAFKRNYIHHVYGDAPVNFSIPKQTFGGCADGRSICEIGGVLYYLGQQGFCAYSGGEPYSISPQLNLKYSSCAAETDGVHYYASAFTEEGNCDVFVYNPEKDIWVREDSTPFIDFCSFNGDVYGIADGKMWLLGCGGNENFTWSAVSKRFTYDTVNHKGLSCMWIRADMDSGADLSVYISADGDEFIQCGEVKGGSGFSVYRIPIRFKKCNSFRIKIVGHGRAVIHDMEITSHNGGRIYG